MEWEMLFHNLDMPTMSVFGRRHRSTFKGNSSLHAWPGRWQFYASAFEG